MELKISDIVIEGRQRGALDPARVQELVTSIEQNSLLHAVVVRRLDDGRWKLVAGEHRLKALETLHFLSRPVRHAGAAVPAGFAPCVSLGDLGELEAEEAELEENIRRVDLTWQERANATARLATLRGKQAAAVGAPAPQVAAIAQEVRGSSEGVNHETTRREIIVAKHLDNPEVAKAKTIDDAWKVLKRQEEVQKNIRLAEQVGRTFNASQHQCHNTDSLAWMAAYTGELFDVICCDPPYGMGADQFGDSGGVAAGAHSYDDSYESWAQMMPLFARYSFQITKPEAHLYAFCDFDRYHEMKRMLEDEGWMVFRTPLIWVKPSGSRTPWVDFGPQRKYEICMYANKGRKPVTKIFPDVVSYPPDQNRGHNAQKPVQLFVDLLRRSVAPGSRVLDPFAGSGPIFPAAHELKCTAVGVELAPEYYALCLKRLEELAAQPDLPLNAASMLGELK